MTPRAAHQAAATQALNPAELQDRVAVQPLAAVAVRAAAMVPARAVATALVRAVGAAVVQGRADLVDLVQAPAEPAQVVAPAAAEAAVDFTEGQIHLDFSPHAWSNSPV